MYRYLLHAASTPDDEGGSGTSSGVIAAVLVIVILMLVIISLVGVLILFFVRRSAVKKNEPENMTLGMLLSHVLYTVVIRMQLYYTQKAPSHVSMFFNPIF